MIFASDLENLPIHLYTLLRNKSKGLHHLHVVDNGHHCTVWKKNSLCFVLKSISNQIMTPWYM